MKSDVIKVLSVNTSEKKGTVKTPVSTIILNDQGVLHDAHSGPWHRQVSMLGAESFRRFSKQAGRELQFGEFAENITTEGVELVATKPLDRFIGKNIELEVTQIGKECHGSSCAIFKEVGNCVMPKEGIFARVIRGGALKPGDTLDYQPKVFRVTIITLSDRASAGIYEDRSGPRIETIIVDYFTQKNRGHQINRTLIPDNAAELRNQVLHAINNKADIIITTGGTGAGKNDLTVETVRPMLDKEIPGIMEMIRVKYGAEKPNALLSTGIAGIISDSLVYTLPGSVKAVNEYMSEILKTLEHLIYMRHGLDAH